MESDTQLTSITDNFLIWSILKLLTFFKDAMESSVLPRLRANVGPAGWMWRYLKISEDHSAIFWEVMGCHGMSWDVMGCHGMSWDVMGHLPTNLANQLFWGKSSLKFQPCNISTSQCRCSYSDEDAALTSRTSDRCQKNQQTDPNTKQDLALWTRKPILRTMFAYSRKHILKKNGKTMEVAARKEKCSWPNGVSVFFPQSTLLKLYLLSPDFSGKMTTKTKALPQNQKRNPNLNPWLQYVINVI